VLRASAAAITVCGIAPLPAVLAATAALAIAAPSAGLQQSRCFGAASRDRAHPCHDPRLDHTVKPEPRNAALVPNAYCRPIERDGPSSFAGGIGVCAFGAEEADAKATFALIGDSHAMTWRAPLTTFALAHGWRGLSITRASCPLTVAALAGPRNNRLGCLAWNRRVVSWLRAHPEVQVVFVAGRSTTPMLLTRRQTQLAAKTDGYRRAWAKLPPTVRHIVAIRDNPQIRFTTFGCVHAAVAARRDPGRACAMSRAAVLPPDPAMAAVARSDPQRVQSVDLTDFMCDSTLCYPVVGGALVDKDATHLATGFATTLGPYLTRRVDRLMRSWR
jgi:SGNH domain (fused to AT3 domains)